MNTIAKAVVAGAGTAGAAYTALQVSGHASWLGLAGCVLSGVLAGLLTWAVPNADPPAPKP